MFGLKQSHIEAINHCFAKYAAIEQAVLYGSRSKGNYKPGSDIDLTIIDNNMSYADLLKLENELDDLMLPYKIDLSLKRQISNPGFIAHIERVGQIFYDKVKQNAFTEPAEKYQTKVSKKK